MSHRPPPRLLLFLLPAALVALSCGKKPSTQSLRPAGGQELTGAVEKGPFVKGSSVNVYPLSATYERLGQPMATAETDDAGRYALGGAPAGGVVELEAAGRYFNEVSGALSDESLRLCAYADLAVSKTINVNVLTTLAAGRIKSLVGEGKTFAEAKAQAQREVLAVFNIPADGVADFEQMSIAGSGTGSAILLAASAVVQGDRDVSQLGAFISRLAIDVAANGAAIDKTNADALIISAMDLNLDAVRANLSKRYADVGAPAALSYFDDFVMSDGIHLNGAIPSAIVLRGIPATVGNAMNAPISVSVALIGRHVERETQVSVRLNDDAIIGISPAVFTFSEGHYRTPQPAILGVLDHAAPGPITLTASGEGLETLTRVIDYPASTLEVFSQQLTGNVTSMAVSENRDIYVVENAQIYKVTPGAQTSFGTLTGVERIAIDKISGAMFAQVGYLIKELDMGTGDVVHEYTCQSQGGATPNGLAAFDGEAYVVIFTSVISPNRSHASIVNPATGRVLTTFDVNGVSDLEIWGDYFYVAGAFYDDKGAARGAIGRISRISPQEPPTILLGADELQALAGVVNAPSIAVDARNLYVPVLTAPDLSGLVITKALSGAKPAQIYCALGVGVPQTGRCGKDGVIQRVNFTAFNATADGVFYFANATNIMSVVPTP